MKTIKYKKQLSGQWEYSRKQGGNIPKIGMAEQFYGYPIDIEKAALIPTNEWGEAIISNEGCLDHKGQSPTGLLVTFYYNGTMSEYVVECHYLAKELESCVLENIECSIVSDSLYSTKVHIGYVPERKRWEIIC